MKMRDLIRLVEEAFELDTAREKSVDEIAAEHAAAVRRPFGICKAVALDLAADLVRHGYRAEVLKCENGQFYAPDADKRWHAIGTAFWWVHYVVKVGDTVYDLTRRQFFPRAPRVAVMSLDQLKNEWQEIQRVK